MAESAIARLRAWSDPRPGEGSLVEIDLFCLDGRLEVGDVLGTAVTPDGIEHAIRGEVLEVRFFDHMIDGLDPVFSGRVLCTGNLGPLREGWDVVASRP